MTFSETLSASEEEKAACQEAFNQVVKGLAKQKWQRSLRKADTRHFLCCYRSPDGKKCAIGQLIPSSLYSPDMEPQVFEEIFVSLKLRAKKHPRLRAKVNLLTSLPTSFLVQLRRAHDYSHNAEEMRAAFRVVAASWGLTSPVEL